MPIDVESVGFSSVRHAPQQVRADITMFARTCRTKYGRLKRRANTVSSNNMITNAVSEHIKAFVPWRASIRAGVIISRCASMMRSMTMADVDGTLYVIDDERRTRRARATEFVVYRTEVGNAFWSYRTTRSYRVSSCCVIDFLAIVSW